MTLEELHRSLPEELRATELPPAIAEAIDFLTARDAAIDAGTPAADVPTFAEWRSSCG
jgi:hypothetical protein